MRASLRHELTDWRSECGHCRLALRLAPRSKIILALWFIAPMAGSFAYSLAVGDFIRLESVWIFAWICGGWVLLLSLPVEQNPDLPSPPWPCV
jgi:hypothetical protein